MTASYNGGLPASVEYDSTWNYCT